MTCFKLEVICPSELRIPLENLGKATVKAANLGESAANIEVTIVGYDHNYVQMSCHAVNQKNQVVTAARIRHPFDSKVETRFVDFIQKFVRQSKLKLSKTERRRSS